MMILQHLNTHPIRIYKGSGFGGFGCDVIEIVYGDVDYNKPGPEQ